MKKILSILAVTSLLTACNSNQKSETELAEERQRTIDSMKLEMAKQQVVDSMNQVAAEAAAVQQDMEQKEKEEKAAVAAAAANRSRSRSSGTRSSGSVTNNYYSNAPSAPANANNPAPAQQTPAQKKRWSSKATGTLIGAGAGALGGALISDKKGQGALIGGAAGAAAGLGTGAIIDAQRKKKEQERLEQQQQQK